MNDRTQQRTIEQAEADAQAMVGELERLVEALRAARAEADVATLATPTAPAVPAPRPPRTAGRPRRPLTSALGLAAVAVVGMVGAAVVTVARDSSSGAESGNGMTPMPYAQTALAVSVPAHGDAAALPLASAAPVAAATDDDAPPRAVDPDSPDEEEHWHRRHWDHLGPGYPSSLTGQELLARALKQAEEAQSQELQALARSASSPPPFVPRLPPYEGQHRRR